MNEPKVTVVLPGFWALNKEEQAKMIEKLEKMKAERDKKQQPEDNEYNLTPEPQEDVRILKEAEKNGTLVIEGWEAMSEFSGSAGGWRGTIDFEGTLPIPPRSETPSTKALRFPVK